MARARLRIVTVRDEDVANNDAPVDAPTSSVSSTAITRGVASTTEPTARKGSAKKDSSRLTATAKRPAAAKAPAEKAATKASAARTAGKAQVEKAVPKPPAVKAPKATAADVMKRDVVTCGPYESLATVGRLMWDNNVGTVVVVDDQQGPVGIVTDRDIAMAAYTQGIPLAHIGIGTCMSQRIITCGSSSGPAEVLDLMRGYQIRRVPVTDEQGKLVGIVGLSDLSSAAAKAPKSGPKVTDVTATLTAILK